MELFPNMLLHSRMRTAQYNEPSLYNDNDMVNASTKVMSL